MYFNDALCCCRNLSHKKVKANSGKCLKSMLLVNTIRIDVIKLIAIESLKVRNVQIPQTLFGLRFVGWIHRKVDTR